VTKEGLYKTLVYEDLRKAALLISVNKQDVKECKTARCLWLTPAILATQEEQGPKPARLYLENTQHKNGLVK
jgi:hypothetical protein